MHFFYEEMSISAICLFLKRERIAKVGKDVKSWNPLHCWLEYKNDTATMGNSLVILQKVKHKITM